MRFNTNREGSFRDYEEFSKFLGLGGTKRQAQPTLAPESSMKSLAMVYPQRQSFIKLFDPEVALQNGTMFEELNKPFYGGSCKGNNNGEGC